MQGSKIRGFEPIATHVYPCGASFEVAERLWWPMLCPGSVWLECGATWVALEHLEAPSYSPHHPH